MNDREPRGPGARTAVMCAAVALPGSVASLLRSLVGGFAVDALTLVVFVPFVWWTMHFLLAGRVGWRRLLPSAVATGIFGIVRGVFCSTS